MSPAGPSYIQRRACAWLVAACVTLTASMANAQSSSTVRYTLPQVYSTALRFLRIDLKYEVTEKDPDAAYLLFRYQTPSKKGSSFGAIELVANKNRVRVVIKLPQMPSYHETVLRDGLLKKLREDYGVDEPPRTPSRDDKKPADDPEEPKPGKKPLEQG